MDRFPAFMKNPLNRVDAAQQNTRDIEGYCFEGKDGSQIAFWECHTDRISEKHTHPFDEYVVCVSGEYRAFLDGERIVLKPGDELFIPEVWEVLGDRILPELIASGKDPLRVWIAGCASGEEVYSLRILWERLKRSPAPRLEITTTPVSSMRSPG